jgi:hypothetical protein
MCTLTWQFSWALFISIGHTAYFKYWHYVIKYWTSFLIQHLKYIFFIWNINGLHTFSLLCFKINACIYKYMESINIVDKVDTQQNVTILKIRDKVSLHTVSLRYIMHKYWLKFFDEDSFKARHEFNWSWY